MINRISGLLEGAEVCVREYVKPIHVYTCAFVAAVCLFSFSLLFSGHTHTQLLSVSMHLTGLKIVIQSMLDLFPHQTHTSSHASR